MTSFAIRFDTVSGVTSDLKMCCTSLNGYKGTLGTAITALDSGMDIRSYAMIRRRLSSVQASLGTAAVKTQGLGNSLDQILSKYRMTESSLISLSEGDIRTPYGTFPGGVEKVQEILKDLVNRNPSTADWHRNRGSILKEVCEALKKMLEDMKETDPSSGAGGQGGGGGRKQDILERLSDMFDFPGDIFDGISDLYDLFDKEGFDKSGIGELFTSFLGILGGTASLADSQTISELYRKAVDLGKDGIGGLKDLLSVFKKADLLPDNNVMSGLLFGLKTVKNAAGFSVSFMENLENNMGDFIGFLRDSGDMADDLSKFIQGLYTSKDGFLKGLEGKALMTVKTWGTAVTSLYTAGAYSIGDIIDKARKGTLDWGSGAESFAKGAIGGLGKIHSFLTFGLVDPDMEKTWNFYQTRAERDAEWVGKYGKNWFTRSGLTICATADTFFGGTAEAIWSNSMDAAEKIVTNAETAINAVKDTGAWIWSNGKKLFSSIW